MGDPVKNILSKQLGAMVSHSAKKELTPESVHHLRVAALRLRFALKFFEKSIHCKDSSKLRKELGAMRKIMGTTRDLDILAGHIDDDAGWIKRISFEKHLIEDHIQSQASYSHQRLIKLVRSARFKKLLYHLKQSMDQADGKEIRPQDLLKEAFREVRLSKKTDLHQIRISLKGLRYACEFLADFYDKRTMGRVINAIIHAQNVLGEYHDARKSAKILRQTEGKASVINMLIQIENDRAGNAKQEFGRMWRNKKAILKYSHLRPAHE